MPAVPDYNKYNLTGEKIPLLLGLLNGARSIFINGRNPDIDTASVPEDLIPQGGVYTFQTTAQSLEVLSSSAADAAAGTGARTILVSGLDADYREISETVILNGVTVVPLTLTYLRVNSVIVVTAGSGLTNAGTITVRVASGGTTLSVIEIGFGLAHQGIYTVPADHTLIILSMLSGSSDGTGAANLQLQIRSSIANAAFISRMLVAMWGFQTAPSEFGLGIRIAEKSDMRLRVISSPADNTALTLTLSGALFRTSDDGL